MEDSDALPRSSSWEKPELFLAPLAGVDFASLRAALESNYGPLASFRPMRSMGFMQFTDVAHHNALLAKGSIDIGEKTVKVELSQGLFLSPLTGVDFAILRTTLESNYGPLASFRPKSPNGFIAFSDEAHHKALLAKGSIEVDGTTINVELSHAKPKKEKDAAQPKKEGKVKSSGGDGPAPGARVRKCEKCGQKGHSGSKCDLFLVDASCRKCGMAGHMSRECPQLEVQPRGGDRGGGRGFNGGRRGGRGFSDRGGFSGGGRGSFGAPRGGDFRGAGRGRGGFDGSRGRSRGSY